MKKLIFLISGLSIMGLQANAQSCSESDVNVDNKMTLTGVAGSSDLMFAVANNSSSTEEYAYIVTNNEGSILAFPPSNELDLSGAPAGTCRVYGISYSGILDKTTGTDISTVSATECFKLSDNWVTVNRVAVLGGEVNVNGASELTEVAGTDELKFTVANNSSSTEEYAYIVTNDEGNVLAFPASNELDLSGAPAGTCRVYGISYKGTLDKTTDVDISAVSSDDEFSLSNNWVSVNRVNEVFGGDVSVNGASELTGLAGTDELKFTVENNSPSKEEYSYIVTDNDGKVLAFPPSNELDLSGAPAGTCRVYGISYKGNLTKETGIDVGSVSADSWMFKLSDNWITVNRVAVSGGEVKVNGASELTGVAGTDDLKFTVENNSLSTKEYAYIVTNNEGNVLAFPPSNELDLSGAPAGTCRVYGISYEGTLDKTTGVNVSTVSSDAGFSLSSNWVTVNRVNEIFGGTVKVNGASELTGVAGTDDLKFTVETNSPSKEEYAYIVTNNEGNVLAFPPSNELDLSGAPAGTCRVYGISYKGTLDKTTGVDISTVSSDDEFNLSSNWVTVNRVAVLGGEVNVNGASELTEVAGTDALKFTVENNSSSTEEYAYIVTNNEGSILAFPPSNELDLSGAPAGVCRVYGISYKGTLDKTTGVDISTVSSDDVFSLSSNWVTVNREDPNGVFTNNGAVAKAVVFPNPATESINVVGSDIEVINIFTATGQKVLTTSNTESISLENLKTGMYLLESVQKDGKVQRSSFVKQ